jgi:hypothetical protein
MQQVAAPSPVQRRVRPPVSVVVSEQDVGAEIPAADGVPVRGIVIYFARKPNQRNQIRGSGLHLTVESDPMFDAID